MNSFPTQPTGGTNCPSLKQIKKIVLYVRSYYSSTYTYCTMCSFHKIPVSNYVIGGHPHSFPHENHTGSSCYPRPIFARDEPLPPYHHAEHTERVFSSSFFFRAEKSWGCLRTQKPMFTIMAIGFGRSRKRSGRGFGGGRGRGGGGLEKNREQRDDRRRREGDGGGCRNGTGT